ncbi:MAG: DUF4860 domain-containing protein [Lachnospirales bacterium]
MEKGSSTLEVVMMMVLLILFAGAIYTMIYATSITQSSIQSEKEAQSNSRVATSYMNVKIKQNDRQNKIVIEKNPITDENALVIIDEFGDGMYNTWIYLEDGILQEQLVTTGFTPESGLGFEIAELTSFNITQEDNKIYTTIEYQENEKEYSLDSIYALKSAQ